MKIPGFGGGATNANKIDMPPANMPGKTGGVRQVNLTYPISPENRRYLFSIMRKQARSILPVMPLTA